MPLVTLETFKKYVRNEAQGLDDDVLEGFRLAAVDAMGDACNREWIEATGTPAARSFQPVGCSPKLSIDDCVTITTVVDNGNTLVTGTDYQALPLDHRSVGSGVVWPYYRLAKPFSDWYSSTGLASVVVTADWGWDTIPGRINQAILTLGKELVNNQDVRFGIAEVADAAAFITRDNKVVRDVVGTFIRYDRAGTAA